MTTKQLTLPTVFALGLAGGLYVSDGRGGFDQVEIVRELAPEDVEVTDAIEKSEIEAKLDAAEVDEVRCAPHLYRNRRDPVIRCTSGTAEFTLDREDWETQRLVTRRDGAVYTRIVGLVE